VPLWCVGVNANAARHMLGIRDEGMLGSRDTHPW
jgi:hypothetical protein